MEKTGLARGLWELGQDWFVFVLYRLLLPMLPLVMVFWVEGAVDKSTLALAAWMYSVAMGAFGRNAVVFALSLLVASPLGLAFLLAEAGSGPLPGGGYVPAGIILLMFAVHARLRFRRGSGWWDSLSGN